MILLLSETTAHQLLTDLTYATTTVYRQILRSFALKAHIQAHLVPLIHIRCILSEQ